MSNFNGGALSSARKKTPFNNGPRKGPHVPRSAGGASGHGGGADGGTSRPARRGGGAAVGAEPVEVGVRQSSPPPPRRPSSRPHGPAPRFARPHRSEGAGETRNEFRKEGRPESRPGNRTETRGENSSGEFRPRRSPAAPRFGRESTPTSRFGRDRGSDFGGPRRAGNGHEMSDRFRGGGNAGSPPRGRPAFHNDRDSFDKPARTKWEFKSEAARSVKPSDFISRSENVSFEVHAHRNGTSASETFGEFSLPEQILKNLVSLGFERPTPIQAQAIPTALSNRDLIGIAQTGTGKTGAFLIPVLSKLIADPTALALVLVPTRELAEQVFKNAQSLSKDLRGINQAILIGGVNMHGQIRALQANPRLIIATPGRLMDHMRSRKSLLARMKYLVLDEADRMVDFGFAPQVLEILSAAPAEHQSLLFSATLPTSVQRFVQRLTKNPLLIQMPREAVNIPKIDEKSMQIEQSRKNETLLDCVNAQVAEGSILVFAKTQIRTEKIHSYLEGYGVGCELIHGGRSQSQRKRSLERFRKGQARVLIATDVAARGIDVDHITLVVNFDLPQSPEDYVHRIGRTGRAGRSGSAVSFVTNEDRRMWSTIQRLMKVQHGTHRREETRSSPRV